jgi:hypothetical protein
LNIIGKGHTLPPKTALALDFSAGEGLSGRTFRAPKIARVRTFMEKAYEKEPLNHE